MESIDQFAFSILGINVILYVAGVIKTILTFRNKRSVPFILIMCGFNCMIISTMLSFGATYWYVDNSVNLVLVDTFFYTQMVQYTLWSYYFRLKTIPKFNNYDKYVFCIPFIIAIIQVPEAIYYNLDSRFDGFNVQMGLSATLSGMAIILSEFIMYFLLVKKLLVFIEVRSISWIVKITATLIVLIGLDFAEITFYFVDKDLSSIFYSLSFNVRLNAIVLFFGDLVEFVKSGQSWKSHQNTPLNSREGSSLETESNSGFIRSAAGRFKRASRIFNVKKERDQTLSHVDYVSTISDE